MTKHTTTQIPATSATRGMLLLHEGWQHRVTEVARKTTGAIYISLVDHFGYPTLLVTHDAGVVDQIV